MRRLWVAVALLTLATGLCVGASLYQHRHIDQMLSSLERLEAAYTHGQTDQALTIAEQLANDYKAVGQVFYCFVAHSDLAESQETVALIPALLREQGPQEELKMEIARLREQLLHLRGIDDPLLQNIL